MDMMGQSFVLPYISFFKAARYDVTFLFVSSLASFGNFLVLIHLCFLFSRLFSDKTIDFVVATIFRLICDNKKQFILVQFIFKCLYNLHKTQRKSCTRLRENASTDFSFNAISFWKNFLAALKMSLDSLRKGNQNLTLFQMLVITMSQMNNNCHPGHYVLKHTYYWKDLKT